MSFQKVIKLLRYYNQKSLLTPAVSLCRQELKYYSKTNYISSSETPVCVDNENADDEEEVEDLTKPLVKITVYFPKENVERQIEVRVGSTVFKSILKHDNTLMQSACNGQLTCRTCHCLVEEGFMHHFSEATDSEEDLLDAFANCQDNSRLACQMRVLQEFEGCRIEVVPEIKKDDDK